MGLALIALAATAGRAQNFDTASWNQPFEPFRVVGPVHYVGTNELCAYLIATPEGHILIDGGLPESAPLIQHSIAALGFKAGDIKVFLTTQAHADHVGSLAALRRGTNAQVMVMAGDAELVENGGKTDYLFGDRLLFAPVHVDRVLQDGDTVSLGGVTLTAHLTPGHTKGSTTWTTTVSEGGKPLSVLFAGSTAVNQGTRLDGMPTYPNVRADFERAFAVQASLSPDVWLGSHSSVFGLEDKRERQKKGEANPFIDPEGWKESVARRKAVFDRLVGQGKEM
jgi:metallo-beta-lactamase class B